MRSRWIVLCLLTGLGLAPLLADQPMSPEDFFGFTMGSDGNLASWERIVDYFHHLDKASDKLQVKVPGESTNGRPFLLVIISSPGNLAQLETLRKAGKQLADPRGLSDEAVESLVRQGKVVSAQSYSLHATEVGGTQCTPELAYQLITGSDETTRMILDNTVFLMFPCFNPDGLSLVKEWYDRYQGTPFNPSRLPYLYHEYTGHDNNRDSYQLTQKESRLYAQIMYRDWAPQSYVDHHHFGSYGARFYIPPYLDPIHPNVDPLIWREHQLYGSFIGVALENAGKSGIESGVPFTGWWQASFHMSANYHNIAGMLTESASADWADPIYILPDQLTGTRGRPEYKPQMSMPRLWEGGWWRLRDIVEQKIIASKAVLELSARNRETLLWNTVRKARGNIERGKTQPPRAFIIPKNQHDFLTAVKLVRLFQENGVEVHRLQSPFRAGSRLFETGSYVIRCDQPMRSFVISFLETVLYPDNVWTRDPKDGSPLRPYDLAGYSLSEHMGVDAVPVETPMEGAELEKVHLPVRPDPGTVSGEGPWYAMDHRINDSFLAANRLLERNIPLYRMKESTAGGRYPSGTVIIQAGEEHGGFLHALARETGLEFTACPEVQGPAWNIRKPRLGLYKRFAGGNMDEGWTRWLLQEFEFSLTSVENEGMRKGTFKSLDVLIFPSDGYQRILLGDTSKTVPPAYRGGIGDKGVNHLRSFVREGGTLILLNQAWELGRDVFDLPLTDESESMASRDFFCPGSTLRLQVDPSHPLAYGMPSRALALFRNSPALAIRSRESQERTSVAARYAEERILQSGWLVGEKVLAGRPAILQFEIGKGKVIVLALPVQHRAQTHGTFKFLFNAVMMSAAGSAVL